MVTSLEPAVAPLFAVAEQLTAVPAAFDVQVAVTPLEVPDAVDVKVAASVTSGSNPQPAIVKDEGVVAPTAKAAVGLVTDVIVGAGVATCPSPRPPLRRSTAPLPGAVLVTVTS
jgi:hypothetical protein